MTKVLVINLEPYWNYFVRKLQFWALFVGGTPVFGLGYGLAAGFTLLLFTPLFFIPLIYFCWMIHDRNAMNTGGRLRKYFRESFLWKLYADYFPVYLHKTADLDPQKNYIIGYHPHGIITAGGSTNFSTEATGFSKLFPGITTYYVTLVANFYLPIRRELMLFQGMISPNKESISYVLSKMGKGNAVVIAIGGAAEALDSVPNTMTLTLRNRKGFVRLAIQHGASLVPCLSFGENEIYSCKSFPDWSVVKVLQKRFARLMTFSLPLFTGRGLLQNLFGVIPRRHPIHTIVGSPIEVVQNLNPSTEEVDSVHSEYMRALEKLFNEHKASYADNPEMDIVFK